MKYEQVKDIIKLNVGDIVKPTGSAVAYVVTGVYGDRATAVRTVDITNAIEWQVLTKQP